MNASADSSGTTIGCLLLPNFSLLEYSSVSEVLAQANEHQGRPLYQVHTLGVETPAVSQGGIKVSCESALFAPKLDVLVVFATRRTPQYCGDEIIQWLQAQSNSGVELVGVGDGIQWLARTGLLRNKTVTVPWWDRLEARNRLPDSELRNCLYLSQDNLSSVAGGMSALHWVLDRVRKHQGEALASTLADHLLIERIRSGDELQRVPLQSRLGQSQPKLTEAVALMEANIEEPLTTEDIAAHVGLSRRQLERLFKRYLNTVPSRYYLQIRLERARKLLRETSLSIVDIGLQCGFSSGPHFSTSYRNHFNITPSEERILRDRR